jgi:hypothetical protein
MAIAGSSDSKAGGKMSWQHEQDWFEMRDLRKARIASSTWIPVFARHQPLEVGNCRQVGHQEEYFGAHAIIVPQQYRDKALQVEWTEASFSHDRRPHIDGDEFKSAGNFDDSATGIVGKRLVLEGTFDGLESSQQFIDQDLILGLRLFREGDSWLCPAEDYIEVVRMKFDESRRCTLIEIRAEHLRDYLNACDSGLLVATYRSRRETQATPPPFPWPSEPVDEKIDGGHWEGRVSEVTEDGFPYGSEVAVIEMVRTDVDLDDEVPVFGHPTNENIGGETRKFQRLGPKCYRLYGEMWRNEWVEPASKSPRFRGDRSTSEVDFIIETDGTTAPGSSLRDEGRWLWFQPHIIGALLERRKSKLVWHSLNTGTISTPLNGDVHFGLNDSGFVNVYAKDIGQLLEAPQRLWNAHNITPDGAVSPELYAVQMKCVVPTTIAPEVEIVLAIQELQEASKEAYGDNLFRSHPVEADLVRAVNRFYSLDRSGFFKLAKEITRLVVERMDMDLLKRLTPDEKKLASIKRLERIVTDCGEDGRELTAPLVGLNELRQADAHLPSTDLSDSFGLLGVTDSGEYMNMAKEMMSNVAVSLQNIQTVISTNVSCGEN